MARRPTVWHYDEDTARGARVAELIEHARPDLDHTMRRPFGSPTYHSPAAPDVLILPESSADLLRGDGQRVVVLGAQTPVEVLAELERWTPPEPARAARPVVLVVDDEPVIARALRRLLDSYLDVGVIAAEDNASGLAAALRARPDLIISDIIRPGGRGFEFVEAVRTHPRLCDTPVIMLSAAYEPHSYRDWAGLAGVVAALQKAFDPVELTKVVAYALGRTALEPRSPEPRSPPPTGSDPVGAIFARLAPSLLVDPRTLPVNPHWRRSGPVSLPALLRARTDVPYFGQSRR